MTESAAELVGRAVRRGGIAALREIAPLGVGGKVTTGFDPDKAHVLTGSTVEVGPAVNPLLAAVFDLAGAVRRGPRTWSVSIGRDANPRVLAACLDALPGGVCYSEGDVDQAATGGGFVNLRRPAVAATLRSALSSSRVGEAALAMSSVDFYQAHSRERHIIGGLVLISVQSSQVYLKVCSSQLAVWVPSMGWLNLDLFGPTTRKDAILMPAHQAMEVFEAAGASLFTVVDTSGTGQLGVLRNTLASSVSAQAVLTSPGLALAVVGSNLPESVERAVRQAIGDALEDPSDGAATRSLVVPVSAVVGLLDGVDSGTVMIAVADDVADVAAMSGASPLAIPGLRKYQAEAVGLHLSTGLGFANCSAPGLGKTVMSLAAARIRALLRSRGLVGTAADIASLDVSALSTFAFIPGLAAPAAHLTVPSATDLGEAITPAMPVEISVAGSVDKDGTVNEVGSVDKDGTVNAAGPVDGERAQRAYRAIIVCPAAIRSQWAREAAVWFPEATTIVLTSKRDVQRLGEGIATAAPVLVIASYEMARSAITALVEVEWDDLFCDEAAILKAPGSGRTKALWELRRCSQVAIALTGTPIDRSVDDLGRVVAWVRDEPELFGATSLSRRFPNLSNDAVRDAFRAAVGPLMFRRDRSEIADELPQISTEVVLLDPSPAELRLANAARSELRRIYEDLVERLEAAQALNPEDPRFEDAKTELAKARGAILGGVTLARMAASDPAAVAASDSAGAQLLKAAGLVEPAVRAGGTKRGQIVELVADLTARGEKVLIFTDFSSVASNLVGDLVDRDVRVGSIMGGQSARLRDEAAVGFQAGDLDCLVLTSAGREGLNLQACSVLINLDLPWSPSQLLQRLGRAARLGNTQKKLSVLIPLMVGTIEERVAAVLIPRAANAVAALDSGKGVAMANTDMGLALGGLADAVMNSTGGDLSMLAIAREVLAA